MSYTDTNKKYLRLFNVHEVKLVDIKNSEWKGVESLVLTFEDTEGRLIDSKFKKPLSDISTNQLRSIKKVLGLNPEAKSKDMLGKELVILVAPNEYKGKTFWNVGKYLPKWTGQFIGKDPDSLDDVFGVDAPKTEASDADDDLGF